MGKRRLDWSDDYLIGVAELDWEHRDLFDRLNVLHGELESHEEPEAIRTTLGEIHARVEAHFALEEHFMRDCRHADYERHKGEHDGFLEEIVDIIEAIRDDPDLSHRIALETRLREWILQHITTSDRALQNAERGHGFWHWLNLARGR